MMPSPPLVVPFRCCAILGVTPIGWPFPIIACWPSSTSASPFTGKNYAQGGKPGQMTLAATEFLRRFFLHVLPKGFVRIRQFGFLVNRAARF